MAMPMKASRAGRVCMLLVLCCGAWQAAPAQSASKDLCAQLQAKVDALGSQGGTVDLRGANGAQNCSATVRITGKPVTVLLGSVTWTSTALPMIRVSGYDKATKFSLLCDHPLMSTLKASATATGPGSALLQLGDSAGDGSRTNTTWGRVEGCGFDGGGVADAIALNSYTAGELSRLSIYNYAHNGIVLRHAWNTLLRAMNLNHGAAGARAALTLDDASNTVLEASQCYAGRAKGVACVWLDGTASSTVALRNVDCGDDGVCVVLPKLAQPITDFVFDHVYFENQDSPVSIGEQGKGQAPRHVMFLGGRVAANPASGPFTIAEASGVSVSNMTLQQAVYGAGVSGLRLDGNSYAVGKTNNAPSALDCDNFGHCVFSSAAEASRP